MQVLLSDKTIDEIDEELPERFISVNLNEQEVRAAKKMIFKFLDSIKQVAENKKLPTLYFTALLVMNIISQERIKLHSPQEIRQILSATQKQDE